MEKEAYTTLLQTLKTIQYPKEKVESIQESGIVTYSDLLTVLGDDTSTPELRIEICYALRALSRHIDKRRIVGSLIAALNSKEPALRSTAAITIGMMRLKRAIPPLSQLATDKNQSDLIRVDAIQALGSMTSTRALAVLRTIVGDETDQLGLRADALEQTASYRDSASLQNYLTLLGDSRPDMRFWAAYCVGQMRYWTNISAALNALDQIILSDHTLPTYWGWHVDREALLPFEFIYFRSLSHDPEATPDNTWIISPAAEFASFIAQYRHWTETRIYRTDVQPQVNLHIDKFWLMTQLQERWRDIAFDVRQPRPQAYSLNFQLLLQNKLLIGGLHRDDYTLVLTGAKETIGEFVAWYRNLFVPVSALYLYEWAGSAIHLTKKSYCSRYSQPHCNAHLTLELFATISFYRSSSPCFNICDQRHCLRWTFRTNATS